MTVRRRDYWFHIVISIFALCLTAAGFLIILVEKFPPELHSWLAHDMVLSISTWAYSTPHNAKIP